MNEKVIVANSSIENAEREYMEILIRKHRLMTSNEGRELYMNINLTIPGVHDAEIKQLIMIKDIYGSACLDALYAAFKYGFVNGRKCEQEHMLT